MPTLNYTDGTVITTAYMNEVDSFMFNKFLTGTVTYDPPSLADGAGTTTTVTVTGAVLGDVALASFSLSTQGITVTANVTATNTVTVRFQNETGGVIDLASGTLGAMIIKLVTPA
jgi:hypothetical protein